MQSTTEADAFVAAWLPGGERALVADRLFDLAPVPGTRPYTWPRGIVQLPAAANEDALFPLGYALTTPELVQ